MIKLELFDDFVIKEKDLKSNMLEILLSIDCHMRINIDNKIFYEDWICPLELYNQYKAWNNKFKENLIQDFNYISEDNAVNPILSFKNIYNNLWQIDSCFKKYNEKKYFTTKEINDFFTEFENILCNHLK